MLTSAPKTLAFIRHGESELNRDNDRFCGDLDPDISLLGREQAARAGEVLSRIFPQIDAAWTSPRKRARQTAELIRPAVEWEVMDDLRETSFGAWEGLTKEEARKLTPEHYAAWEQDPYLHGPPGGESGLQTTARIEGILDAVARFPARTIVVVSHKTFLRFLVGTVIGIPLHEVRTRLDVQTGRIGILELSGQRGKLMGLNL